MPEALSAVNAPAFPGEVRAPQRCDHPTGLGLHDDDLSLCDQILQRLGCADLGEGGATPKAAVPVDRRSDTKIGGDQIGQLGRPPEFVGEAVDVVVGGVGSSAAVVDTAVEAQAVAIIANPNRVAARRGLIVGSLLALAMPPCPSGLRSAYPERQAGSV